MTKERNEQRSVRQSEKEQPSSRPELQVFPDAHASANTARMKRVWEDPMKRQQLIQAQKDAWSHPEKRKERIERAQSPTAKKNRSDAIKKRYKEDPTYKKAQKESAKRRGELHMKEVLGEYPKEKMKHLLRGRNYGDVAAELGVSYSTVRAWKRKLRIK